MMERKETLESHLVNGSNKFAIWHTMTNSSSMQQKVGIHEYILVRTNTYSYVVQQRTV